MKPGIVTAALAIGLASLPAAACAQDVNEFQEVEVVGLRDPFRLTANEVAAGLAVLRRERPSLAPQGTAYLEIGDATSATDSKRLRLKLVPADGGEPITVSSDAEGRFALPDVPAGYTLFTNRRNASARPMIAVYSPGTSPRDRRVGDLRLECDVWWAMIRGRVNFAVRAMLGNPCTSKRFAKYNDADGAIAQAVVVWSTAARPVELSRNRRRYRSPVFDRSLPADARVQITLVP